MTVVATIVAVFVLDDGAGRCAGGHRHRHGGRAGGADLAAACRAAAGVRPRSRAADEPVRAAAAAGRPRDLGRRLRRPAAARPDRRPARGRAVRRRRQDRERDGARAARLPHGVAGVRVLARGGHRGAADVRLRADVHVAARLLVVARARAAGAVAGRLLAAPEFAPAERVVAPLAFSGALLVAYTTLSIAASRANSTRPLLAGRRRRRRRQRRPQPAADPDVRHGGRRRGDGRRLRRAGRRHGVARAAAVSGAVRVAPADDRRRVGVAAVRGRPAGRRAARWSAPLAAAYPWCWGAGVLPAGRATSARHPGGENTHRDDPRPPRTRAGGRRRRARHDRGGAGAAARPAGRGCESVAATPHVHPAYPTTVRCATSGSRRCRRPRPPPG